MSCSTFGTSEWGTASIKKREDKSQMLKRICGSFKRELLENSVLPEIYGPKEIRDGICELEVLSEKVSRLPSLIINQSSLVEICKGREVDELTEIKESDIREETDYYYKKFRVGDETSDEIREKIQQFRQYIGGVHTRIETIETRLAPEYKEDIVKPPRQLTLEDLNNKQIVRFALNHSEPTTRIRMVYGENERYFVLMFNHPQNVFMWDGICYQREEQKSIYDCFISAGITTHKLPRLRSAVANYIDDHFVENPAWSEELYEKVNSGAWDRDMLEIVACALANLLSVNIYIYEFRVVYESSSEEALFDKPFIVRPVESTQTIHIKYNNDFELLKLF
jgi:hypothetical protein